MRLLTGNRCYGYSVQYSNTIPSLITLYLCILVERDQRLWSSTVYTIGNGQRARRVLVGGGVNCRWCAVVARPFKKKKKKLIILRCIVRALIWVPVIVFAPQTPGNLITPLTLAVNCTRTPVNVTCLI